MAALGSSYGADLFEQEINFLIEHEWAININDIIWRRTKRGLYLTTQEIKEITHYINRHPLIIAKKAPKSVKVA